MEEPTVKKDLQVEGIDYPTVLVDPDPDQSKTKRGWVVDQIMLIGQAEAALGHIDERICDLWHDIEMMEGTDTEEKLVAELAELYDLTKTLYSMRTEAEEQVFNAFPDADRTKWCLVKHLAMTYAIAEENFHARQCDPDAEKVMLKAGEAVAKTAAMAFGFAPFGCFRCLSEAMSGQDDASK